MFRIPDKWLALAVVASALVMAVHNKDYGPAAMEVIAMVAVSQVPK